MGMGGFLSGGTGLIARDDTPAFATRKLIPLALLLASLASCAPRRRAHDDGRGRVDTPKSGSCVATGEDVERWVREDVQTAGGQATVTVTQFRDAACRDALQAYQITGPVVTNGNGPIDPNNTDKPARVDVQAMRVVAYAPEVVAALGKGPSAFCGQAWEAHKFMDVTAAACVNAGLIADDEAAFVRRAVANVFLFR